MHRPTTTSTNCVQLASLEWLLAHHSAKHKHRSHLVTRLPLRDSRHLLDIGCGPGLWTQLLTSAIAPTGRVTGIDSDPAHISFAARLNGQLAKRRQAAFLVADISDLPIQPETADAVFCNNVYSYLTEPVLALKGHYGLLQAGGRMIVRQFDNGVTLFSGIEPNLISKVLHCAGRSLESNCSGRSFDNYLGRNLLSLIRAAELPTPHISTDAVQLTAPLSIGAKDYLRRKGQWLGEIAAPYLSKEERVAWNDSFDVTGERCILNRPDFYFCTVEVQAIVRRN